MINHIFTAGFIGAFTLMVAWPRSTAFASDPVFQVDAGERQLFLDDVDIAKIENLTQTMHKPDKRGAVIRGDYLKYPGCNPQTRSSPIWDPERKLYKLWVLGVAPAPPDITVQGGFSGYYESKDGLNWTLPIVGEVDFGDNKQNNFVTAKISGRYGRTDCVVYDPTDPDPNRRYKLAWPDVWHPHTNQISQDGGAVQCDGGFAVSPDGIHWTEETTPGLPSQDEYSLSFDEKEKLFIHYVKHRGHELKRPISGKPFKGRAIHISTSRDFRNWTPYKLVFSADQEDQQIALKRIAERMADKTRKFPGYNVPETYRAEVYHMSIFRYESRYIGVPAYSYHAGSVSKDWPGFDKLHLSPAIKAATSKYGDYTWFFELQLCSSRDLYNWDRLGEREPWLENSPMGAGAYDLITIISPAGVVLRGDEMWFYYTGINRYTFISAGNLPGYDDYRTDKGAVCLAVMRRDGYISLDAGEQAGTIQTEPFKLPGTKLFVNVDAPKGEFRVELLNGDGNVVAKSKPLTGDLLREPVKWAKGDIAGLKDQTASLRFTLRNGQFYSYWLE